MASAPRTFTAPRPSSRPESRGSSIRTPFTVCRMRYYGTSAPSTGRSPGLGVPAAPLDELPADVAKSCNPDTTREEPMPNGGSDCCGTCWFNRSLEGQRGSGNFNRETPSHCEIRDLDIPDPFYTYCANHPSTDQAETPSPLGRYTFTARLDHRGKAGAKSGSPRRTRRRSGNTCSISSACLRSTPMRATTSIRDRRTSRRSCSCLNGVMGGSFRRWKRLRGTRKLSAFASTSRRP